MYNILYIVEYTHKVNVIVQLYVSMTTVVFKESYQALFVMDEHPD